MFREEGSKSERYIPKRGERAERHDKEDKRTPLEATRPSCKLIRVKM